MRQASCSDQVAIPDKSAALAADTLTWGGAAKRQAIGWQRCDAAIATNTLAWEGAAQRHNAGWQRGDAALATGALNWGGAAQRYATGWRQWLAQASPPTS